MFAYDILAKTRTLIDAKESGYAAGNTFNQTSNCRAKEPSRLAALLRPLSRATSNPLRLGRKRQSKQPSHAISETPQLLGGPCYGANSRTLCRKGGSSQYAQQCRILASYFLHVLTLASVIPMWSHWFELSASLGFYPATCVLTAITGAALIVSLWVNTDNE
jgi:hypothetical protein